MLLYEQSVWLSLTPESNHQLRAQHAAPLHTEFIMVTIENTGGRKIRALREAAGKTQLDVELDASLGTGYLQRVESGKVRQPERETLERILTALDARYTVRREILELYDYHVDTPIPELDDIQWAIGRCQQALDTAAFPAYLLDCTHRLLAWNDLASLLLGCDLTRLQHVSMLKILFNPELGVSPRIDNPETFYPATIRAFRYEMEAFRGESWYGDVIQDMLDSSLHFRQVWASTSADHEIAARPQTPIVFRLPADVILKFRLTTETFAQDRRFRLVYYLPADAVTIQQCTLWLSQQGTP